MKKLGIYIHIPFCTEKCGYCDFYSVAGTEDETRERYVSALLLHIREYAALCAACEVDTVYFGGGTPAMIGSRRIALILKEIIKQYKISKYPEITVELNPEYQDKGFLKSIRKAGVNRLSIGAQSLVEGELSTLTRRHTASDTAALYNLARTAGYKNISLDLMYALPGQIMDALMQSLEGILELSPEHISAYNLKLSESVPLFERRRELPEDDVQADMYAKIVSTLSSEGYEQYEISNFAQKNFLSQHNMKYWDLSEYLGFGSSAHSFFGGRRFSYVKDIAAYIDGITNKAEVLDEHEEVATYTRPAEYIMLGLRTKNGIDENIFLRNHGMDFSPFIERLRQYETYGYCEHELSRWYLTPKGYFVSNTIISALLTDLESTTVRVAE